MSMSSGEEERRKEGREGEREGKMWRERGREGRGKKSHSSTPAVQGSPVRSLRSPPGLPSFYRAWTGKAPQNSRNISQDPETSSEAEQSRYNVAGFHERQLSSGTFQSTKERKAERCQGHKQGLGKNLEERDNRGRENKRKPW